MQPKRKNNLSPEAAKLLEQYRNAGKSPGQKSAESGIPNGETPLPSGKPTAPPPGGAAMRRSGTRGK
jgi:hypothetical protein